MQRWLKRAGLILFFGLWAAAGLQIWAKKQESREMEAVAAFSNIGTDNRSGIVQYYGKLKKEKQVQMLERREEYLRQIAASLGISSQILVYRTYGEDSQSVVLQKEGANADTVLRLVTWREKGAITGQSLYANVTIPGGGFEEAQTLRTKMQNVLDETMESKRSSVAVQGFYLGNLSEEKKEAHETIGAGMPVLSMISSGTPEVEINLPAAEYIRRDQFDNYHCTFDIYPGETYPLKLISVTPKANANQLYTMRLQVVPGTPAVPSPGMNTMVTISYRTEQTNTLSVPTGAILQKEGKAYVFVFNPSDNTVHKQEISMLRLLNNGHSLITAGQLKPGELIVSSGVHHIEDGETVKPLPLVTNTNIGGLL